MCQRRFRGPPLRSCVADHTALAHEIERVDDRLESVGTFLESPVPHRRRDAALDFLTSRAGQAARGDLSAFDASRWRHGDLDLDDTAEARIHTQSFGLVA